MPPRHAQASGRHPSLKALAGRPPGSRPLEALAVTPPPPPPLPPPPKRMAASSPGSSRPPAGSATACRRRSSGARMRSAACTGGGAPSWGCTCAKERPRGGGLPANLESPGFMPRKGSERASGGEQRPFQQQRGQLGADARARRLGHWQALRLSVIMQPCSHAVRAHPGAPPVQQPRLHRVPGAAAPCTATCPPAARLPTHPSESWFHRGSMSTEWGTMASTNEGCCTPCRHRSRQQLQRG